MGPAGGPVELYVLRLPTQARPRGISPSPSAGTRFPQVAGATRPARLPAQKLQASAAWTLCIGFAHFSLVRAPSATSSPNLVARWVSRRLPLMRSENRAYFAGYRGLGPLIAGEQPKLCRSAAGKTPPPPGGCHGYPFFHFSNCSVATFSEGGGPRSGSADSGSDPACGLVQLYVLRLPTQARPRGISPSPSAGTRFPQVAGATRPGRLPAQKTAIIGCVDHMHRFCALLPRSRAVCHELSQFGRQVGFSAAAAHPVRKSRLFWRISRAGTFNRR